MGAKYRKVAHPKRGLPPRAVVLHSQLYVLCQQKLKGLAMAAVGAFRVVGLGLPSLRRLWEALILIQASSFQISHWRQILLNPWYQPSQDWSLWHLLERKSSLGCPTELLGSLSADRETIAKILWCPIC